MFRSLLTPCLLLFSAHIGLSQEEYTSPLLHNGNIIKAAAEKNRTASDIDSTFTYDISNLDIKYVNDDFSTDKFVNYNVAYGAAGVTDQWYFKIMNSAGTAPMPTDIILCDSSHARRDSVFVVTGVPTTFSYYDFPEVDVQINDLCELPIVSQSRTLFEECIVITDSIFEGVPDPTSDTVFFTGAPNTDPDFKQDSIHIFNAILDDTNKIWLDSYACRNFGLAFQPWSLGVVTLDGVDETGWPKDIDNPSAYGISDYLTSKPINLNGLVDVYLDFIYQAEGNCDSPEAIDSLVLEFYYPPDDKWVQSGWNTPGGIANDVWDTVHWAIPSFFLVDGFQFRFYNKASTSGWLDHWHIDYIRLKDNQLPEAPNFNDLAISSPPYTLLMDYASVPWDHFKNATASEKMLDELTLKVYNCDNTPSGKLPGSFQVDFMGVIDGGPYALPVSGSWPVGIENYPISVASSYTYDNGITTDPQATFDVKINIATDGAIGSKNSIPDNDTVRFKQEFKNYYAYDDGSAELAYGVTGNRSLLAYKFEAYEEDTLTGILMSFVPSVDDLSSHIFLLTVWADDGTGQPGDIIYQDDFFSPHSPEYSGAKNGFRYYTFADGMGVKVPETFYVGWDQIEDDRLNIGLDMNIPNNDKIFFNVDGTWQTSSFEGSLLIRPVFSTALNYTLYNPEFESNEIEITVYPNPTTGLTYFKGLEGIDQTLDVYDMSGRLIESVYLQDYIDLSAYEKGIYLIQIKNTQGDLIDTKKVTKY